jgi:hypothetical protein
MVAEFVFFMKLAVAGKSVGIVPFGIAVAARLIFAILLAALLSILYIMWRVAMAALEAYKTLAPTVKDFLSWFKTQSSPARNEPVS